MKKRIFLATLLVMVLTCLMAVAVFAAEPNTNGETVTLSDSTVLPIWDTEGDALIWYKSTANADDGYANYDYVKAQASEVSYVTSWAGDINGVWVYQLKTVTITVGGVNYGKNDIVVFNIKDEDVVVTGSSNKGKPITCLSETFSSSQSVEYAFLRLDTAAIMASAFSNAPNLKYVNFHELTQLNRICGQAFTNCTSLFAGKTLDLSNTVMKTLESGTFNNTPVAEIRFPETLMYLNSWSLQGLTKVKEIHIPETIVSFGDTMFKNCYELETVTGYKSLFERNVISTIQGSTFLDCKALKSVDFPDSYTAIGGSALRGTLSYTGTFKISNDCTSIGSCAFQNSAFDTIIVGAGVTTISDNVFRASALKYVFISKNVESIDREVFRDMPNKVVVYYTGDSAEDLKSLTVNNYNGVITDASTICVSASKFDVENKENKNYIVYGYDNCTAFFGGHKLSENLEKLLTSYFEPIYFAGKCLNSGCDFKGADQSKTIGALFVDYGYSATEAPINGTYSMSQFYGINREAVEQYKAVSENFEFGFVVAANADPFGAVANGTLSADKFFVTEEKFFAFDYVAVSIGGITTETANKAVAFCMFVKDGSEVRYLDNGATVEQVSMKSYSDVVSLLENK